MAKRNIPRAKHLYVVSCGGLIKIGATTNVGRRLRALQVGSPFTVTLERMWDVPEDRVFRIEAWVHRRLSEHRVRGEWFKIDLSIIDEIEPEVFEWAFRGITLDPDDYTEADRFALSILAQGRFLTVPEQETYSAMIAAQEANLNSPAP